MLSCFEPFDFVQNEDPDLLLVVTDCTLFNLQPGFHFKDDPLHWWVNIHAYYNLISFCMLYLMRCFTDSMHHYVSRQCLFAVCLQHFILYLSDHCVLSLTKVASADTNLARLLHLSGPRWYQVKWPSAEEVWVSLV